MTRASYRAPAIALALLLAAAAPAVAEPESTPDDGPGPAPRGALDVASELVLGGGPPRQRVGAALTAYVTRRLGLRAAIHHVSLEPFAEAGLAAVGVTYRAAAARPRLEVVVRAEAGVAWPLAPAIGVGAMTYLWPTRWPVAVTLDLGATAIVDGVVDSRLVIALGLGLSLAR